MYTGRLKKEEKGNEQVEEDRGMIGHDIPKEGIY